MNNYRISQHAFLPARSALLVAILALGSYSGLAAAAAVEVTLSGAQEVPAVETAATGSGTITVGADGAVSGSITTTGITGTMAHIHAGASGSNGPPVITLVKDGDTYSVPGDAKLTEAQIASFESGGLYVNVHSAGHPGGEIRAQLTP